MPAWQLRQRPPSSSQLSSGRLSRQAIGVWPAGQRDPGRTSDSRRGTRWITTLANEPASSPARPARSAAVTGLMGRSLPAGRAGGRRGSTGWRLPGRAGSHLLPGDLLELGPAEAEGVGDPRRVAHVQAVLGVDVVPVVRTLVALVAAGRVAVVLQLDRAVGAVEQHRHLRPELDLVAALDRRAGAPVAGSARV